MCRVLCAVPAAQVLSKELLSAVQVVESEILSSQDALPAATLKFFLKAGRTMGQGWVSVSGGGMRYNTSVASGGCNMTLKFFLKAGRTMGQGWASLLEDSDHWMVCAFGSRCMRLSTAI